MLKGSFCGGGGGGGGGGLQSRISKTTLLSDKRQGALDGPRRDLKLLQRSFSGQVNIEVTRGHQMSNFGKITIFPQTIASNFKSLIARRHERPPPPRFRVPGDVPPVIANFKEKF